MSKRLKWIAIAKDDKATSSSIHQFSQAVEDLLNAPKEDREILARKHSFLAPFVTGTFGQN